MPTVSSFPGQGKGPNATRAGAGDALPRFVMGGGAGARGDGCFSPAPGTLRGLDAPRTGPTAGEVELAVELLSRSLDVEIHYPQSTEERRFLLLACGQGSGGSQKRVWRRVSPRLVARRT